MFKHKIIKVKYNNKYYAIIEVTYNKQIIPVLFDYKNLIDIKLNCLRLKCDNSCNIICNNKKNIHNIIMNDNHNKYYNINGLGIDNRIINIDIIKPNKKRKTNLISYNLPYYISYNKANNIHGDKFIIKLPNYKWTSPSSKTMTTQEKYNITIRQAYLLRCTNKHLFNDNELIKLKQYTIKTFYNIIYKAGYTYIKRLYLDYLGNFKNNNYNKKIKSNNLNKTKLPKYIFYRKPYKNRGSFYAIENHPKLSNKIWRSTTSKYVTDIQKYKETINFYNSL